MFTNYSYIILNWCKDKNVCIFCHKQEQIERVTFVFDDDNIDFKEIYSYLKKSKHEIKIISFNL